MKYDRDLLVVGGGAAGLTAAGMGAVLGASTTLIEAGKLGGDCTWHGCVPSKSFLKAAKVAHEMRNAKRYGLTAADPEHDFAQVMGRVRAIREHVYEDADAPPNMEKLGVEILQGKARFLDPHTLEVSGSGGIRKLSARKIVLATGSKPRMPVLEGRDALPVLTNESIFELQKLPRRLVILGSGPIGMEMAQAFRRLGSEVTVVNRSAGILSRDDRELSELLLTHLRGEGIQFVFGTTIKALEPEMVITEDGQRLDADALLIAAGRRPNIESLQLEVAGVATNEKGVIVDTRCRSSVGHIFACGDVAGRFLFTHMAEHMAKTAVTNAILRVPASIDEDHITWSTFTDPELAQLGRTEEELKSAGKKFAVYRFPYSRLDRAITESETTGMVKVMADRWGKILGASILGAHAGELIAELAVAMKNGVSLSGISSTIHAYPTYALANRRVADQYVSGFLSPRVVSWIQFLFRLRGSNQGVRNL